VSMGGLLGYGLRAVGMARCSFLSVDVRGCMVFFGAIV
jgi:hypothetical protein